MDKMFQVSASASVLLNIHWKDWGWSWNSNTLVTWCEEPTHRKRSWFWERSKAGVEGGGRGWDGRMAWSTQCTWVWANSGRWWRTGKLGMLQSMGSQSVRPSLLTYQQQSYFSLSSFFFFFLMDKVFQVWCDLDNFSLWLFVNSGQLQVLQESLDLCRV